MDLRENEEEVTKAQEKVLKRVESSKELEVSRQRTPADLLFLQFKECEIEEDGMVEWFMFPGVVSTDQLYSAGGMAQTLKLSRNEVAELEQRDFYRYNLKMKYGSYTKGTTIPIAR